jgi:hypothetical protein
VVAERASAIRALLAPRLELDADGQRLTPEWSEPEILRERQSLRLRLRYPAAAAPGTVALNTIMFPYDPQHQTFVNMYEGETLTSQMILDDKHPHLEYFAGTRQGVVAVVKKFIPAGIHHILIGPDPHLSSSWACCCSAARCASCCLSSPDSPSRTASRCRWRR